MIETLDAKDRAILRELDGDVRASYTEIAKRTRLSKEVVQYRVKQLEARGIITGYWALLRLGSAYSLYKILIKNRSLGKTERGALVDFVLAQPFVSWFADTEGNFDYIITITTSNEGTVASFMRDLLHKFGSHFQERHILKSTAATLTNEKYLYPTGEIVQRYDIEFLTRIPEGDDVDRVLLRELSLNSRATYVELGAAAGLTAEAIAYRMKHTLPAHIAGHKLRVNPQKLGLSYYHVFLTLQDQSRRQDILQYYVGHPACVALMHHVGYYDLHLELVVRNEEIDAVMDDLRATFGAALAGYELLLVRKEHTMHMLR